MDMTKKWKSYFIQLLTFKQMHESVHELVSAWPHACICALLGYGKTTILIQQLNKALLIKRWRYTILLLV